jgi:dinuclear metal center YbgI/SA1388 family protein
MPLTVSDIIALMETVAPPELAESWDNVGLAVGGAAWPVEKVWVALDPSPEIVRAACEDSIDLLVTHHPLILKPLTVIDDRWPIGHVVHMAIAHQLAIYCAHTNLDSVQDGLNDLLCQRIGLTDSTVLPTDSAKPIDTAVTSAHGIGRLGRLPSAMSLPRLATQIKSALAVDQVRYCGDDELVVRRVAVCTGSGSSLIDQFFASDAEAFVTGDLKYHDARDAESVGKGLVDVGHFASEHLMVAHVADRLKALAAERRLTVSVEPCRIERDPFKYI